MRQRTMERTDPEKQRTNKEAYSFPYERGVRSKFLVND